MKKPALLTRRQVLIALANIPPALMLAKANVVLAATTNSSFLAVSKLIAGTDQLSQDVADRIAGLLSQRDADFDAHLDQLIHALDQTEGGRDAKLAALSDDLVSFALQIAKPWYVGYVGTPSDFVMDDDAAFATFLQAQSYEKIIDVVPRPTYPPAGPGWWGSPPPGVDAPSMPDQVVTWNYYPSVPDHIREPDSVWRDYVTGDYDDMDAATGAKPS